MKIDSYKNIESTTYSAECRIYVELSRNGHVIDSQIIVTNLTPDDLYIYSIDTGSSEDVKAIEVHFINALRGADQNLATVDRVWQISETNLSLVIENRSDRLTLTSGTPLQLKEGYKLAIRSIDIDGNKVYVELSKNETVIDSEVLLPPAPMLYKKGLNLYNKGKYMEAIIVFDEAIEIDPQYTAAWCHKGFAFDELGRHEDAIKAYEKAIEIDPQLAESALIENGQSLYGRGKYDEAISAFDLVIQLDPENELAWKNKGDSLYGLGMYHDSLDAFNRAIDIDQNHTAAWTDRGRALAALGNYSGAIAAYDRAIEIDPEYKWAWWTAPLITDKWLSNGI
jgi:tetratricopeptide (TPR) repeat protein